MMAFWSIWWVWLSTALVLAILEALVPGFVFLGFAIGAVLVSLLLLLGFAPKLSLLLLVFAALSLAAWLVLRRLFALPKGQVRIIKTDIND